MGVESEDLRCDKHERVDRPEQQGGETHSGGTQGGRCVGHKHTSHVAELGLGDEKQINT